MFNHLTATQKGLALAFIGYTCFAFSDANVKYLTSELGYSTYQLIVVDTAIGAAMMLLVSKYLGGIKSLYDKSNAKIHGLRILFNTAVNLLFVYCVSIMPLASLYTIVFTLPFIAVIISIPLYGEKVGIHRWTSIIVGFAGVVVAFQPWQADADFYMLAVALLTAVFITLMFLISRSFNKDVSLLSVGFYPVFGSCILVMPLGIMHFEPIPLEHIMFFALSGGLMSTAIICLSFAFKIADSAAITPLIYTEIVWAILFGIIIFGDIPKPLELVGAAIIIASGLYLIYRERKSGQILES